MTDLPVTIATVATSDAPSTSRSTRTTPPLRAVDGRVPGRRGLATRQRLLECTVELLGTTPYRDLKVTDITRAAGTSPATFYQYFVDLETVLLAVAEQTAAEGQQLIELIADRPWKGAAGVASAEGLVDGFIDFWRTHRPTLRVLDLLSTEGDKRFRHLRVVMHDVLLTCPHRSHNALLLSSVGTGASTLNGDHTRHNEISQSIFGDRNNRFRQPLSG